MREEDWRRIEKNTGFTKEGYAEYQRLMDESPEIVTVGDLVDVLSELPRHTKIKDATYYGGIYLALRGDTLILHGEYGGDWGSPGDKPLGVLE